MVSYRFVNTELWEKWFQSWFDVQTALAYKSHLRQIGVSNQDLCFFLVGVLA